MNALNAVTCAVILLLLAGCSDDPIGPVRNDDHIITDVSFQPAHKYDDCGAKRGCTSVYVTDKWYIRFCDANRKSDCFWRSVRHAPWEWQTVGAKVTVIWRDHERGWRLYGFILNGERVEL